MPSHRTRRPEWERACTQCGLVYWPFDESSRFCSKACHGLSMTTLVARICEICGASFMAKPSHVAQGKERFCARPCADVWHSIRLGTAEDRFWSLVDKTGDCWPRGGAHDGRGYAVFDSRRASHFAYVMRSGIAIPTGTCILHTCDNRACVRNDDEGVYVVRGRDLPRWGHLALGTKLENQWDKIDKGRQARGEGAGAAKLTEAQVVEIRRLYQTGAIKAHLALQFGIHPTTVADIIKRHIWSHLPPPE
jgi:hypothetical protein